jgi:hypothetical protein
MISSFSDAGYLIRGRPHPRSCFFEQAVFEGEVSDRLLQRAHLVAQVLHLARGGLPRRVARKAALANLQELLRPAVVEAFSDPLPPAQLGDRRLAA